MGVDMRLHIWPEPENLLDHSGFVRFIKRLVQEELVAMPCTLLSGAINPERPYSVGDQSYIDGRWQQVPIYIIGDNQPGLTVVYKGYSLDELLSALRQQPFDDCDLCVTFATFNWDNAALQASFEERGFANARVTIYALHKPHPIVVYDAYNPEPNDSEHPMQQFFVADGKRGPDSIIGTPLEPLLRETFGPDLWMECTYW